MADSLAKVRKALEKAQAAAREAETFDGSRLAAQMADIASLLERPPLVAVIGEFDAGKSTLINRLLGVDVLPTDVLPTTARPARIQHGDRPGLVLNWRSGFRELRAIDELKHYGHKNDPQIDSSGLAEVTMLEVFLPNPVLHSFQMLDTPGLSDPDQDVELTLSAIREADAIIWCSMATQAWKSSEVEFWSRMPEDVRKTAILVVTHCDLLNDDKDRERVRRRVEAETKDAFGRVIMASLWRGKGGYDDGSVSAIQAAIQEMVVGRAHELRAAWAIRSTTKAIEMERSENGEDFAERRVAFEKLKHACGDMMDEWSSTRNTVRKQLQSTSQQFDSLFEKAGLMARDIITRWKFKEPEQVCIKGIFTDDYKVIWRQRWMEDLDWDEIPNKHAELTKQVWKIVESAASEIGKKVDEFIETLTDVLDLFLEPLEATTLHAVGLLHQHALLIDSVFTSAAHRSIGSIEGGGFHYASMSHTQVREHRKALPTGSELRGLLGSCFSFDVAASICLENGISQLDAMSKDVVEMLEYWAAAGERDEELMTKFHKELDGIYDIVSLDRQAANKKNR